MMKRLLLLIFLLPIFAHAQTGPVYRIQRAGTTVQINSDGSVTVTLATGKTFGLVCQPSLPVSGSVGQMACKSGTGAGVYTWDSGTSAWLLWGDVAAGLNATKIGAGTVSNTEFGYLDGVTSAIQTQLDAKESALTFSSPLSRSVNTISCPTCAVTGTGLNQFASTTSAQLAGVISNETGTGSLVFGTSPNITTPTGIVKGDVGLGNVDNTSDANKPVSTAQQTALDLKANLASPPLTGTPTAPTASAGTSTTQLSTTAFVSSSITNDGTSAIITKPLGLGAAPTSNLDGISPVLLNLKSGTGNHALTYGGQTGVSGSLKMESWVGENAGRVMRWAYDPTGAGALEGYYGDEDGLYTSVGSAGFYFSVTGVNRALSAMGDYYDNGHHTDIEVDDYAQTATVTTVNGTTVNGPLTANQFSSSGATITGGSITGLSTFAAPSVSPLPGTNSFGQVFARSSDGTFHFGYGVNSIAQVWTANVNTSLAEVNLSCADAGSTDAYACNLSPAITAYGPVGTHYRFYANTSNTGAASINFNSLGALTLVKVAGGVTTALADNDIRAGQWVDCIVAAGSRCQVQSTLGNAAGGSGTVTVVSSGNLTSTALVTGGGTQTLQTPSATSTLDSSGNLALAGGATIAAGSTVCFSGRSCIQSTADSNLMLSNNAGTAFSLLRFGGTTSSFPAFRRNGASLEARTADDANYTNFTAQSFTPNAQFKPAIASTGSVSGSLTINGDSGQVRYFTLTGNVTSITLANQAGGPYFLCFIQGGAGSFTVTWPSTIKWAGGSAPTLTTAVGARDCFTFFGDNTNLYESARTLDVK
jgi:hypothetical protein